MYVKAEEWELALDAFKSCSNWRQAFCMAATLKYNRENQVDLAQKLASKIQIEILILHNVIGIYKTKLKYHTFHVVLFCKMIAALGEGDVEEIKILLILILDQLRNNKKYVDAAIVLEEYASDIEEAIVCLIEGCQWEEALRRVYLVVCYF